MTEAIKAAYSMKETFKPFSWQACDVVVVRDDDGSPIGFVETGKNCRILEELPTELFNHELKELDTDNPEKVATFMSAFGMVGTNFDVRPYHYAIGQRGVCALELCWLIPSDYEQYEGKFGGENYARLERLIAKALNVDSLGDEQGFLRYIEYGDALGILSELGLFADVFKALATCTSTDKVAKFLHTDESEVVERLNELTEHINRVLRGHAPMMGFVIGDGGAPSFLKNRDTSGCFESAYILQLWLFGVTADDNPDAVQVCSECGAVFEIKRSASSRRKNAGKSGNESFCCDKCKSRKSSRDYRRNLKMMKQKNDAAMAAKEQNNG